LKKNDIKSMNLMELTDYVTSIGEKKFHASQIYGWLHRKLVVDFDGMTDISKGLRQKLKHECEITAFSIADAKESSLDKTCKYLFRLQDNNTIECVSMKYEHGRSICISSQVGCRMGCAFCASAVGGYKRNLTVSELLESVYAIARIMESKPSNIVIMGIGEPMDNYNNVVKFIHMISNNDGLNISQRSITVSTCGIPDMIRRFAEEGLNVTLALSLHSTNERTRRDLLPVANKYPLQEVMSAFDYYYEKTKRRLTYEYSMIKGVNDDEKEAQDLGRILKGRNANVNLIRVNPIKEHGFERPDMKVVANFKNVLEKNRINVTIRREMGSDIGAACGQLRALRMFGKDGDLPL